MNDERMRHQVWTFNKFENKAGRFKKKKKQKDLKYQKSPAAFSAEPVSFGMVSASVKKMGNALDVQAENSRDMNKRILRLVSSFSSIIAQANVS